MNKSLHDRSICFRANNRLIEAATARAHESGMSLAELLRSSLRAAASGTFELKGSING